jgi:hypothetical protein
MSSIAVIHRPCGKYPGFHHTERSIVGWILAGISIVGWMFTGWFA